LLVAIVDPPSDRSSLYGFRITRAHALDIKGVIAYLRQQAPVPVWLVGTSYGTVSAIKVADWLAEGGGPTSGDYCEPFDYHGFPGIEGQVVDAISAWIVAHPPK
jgi:hypothetical protein